jgi:hypothetical protein
MSAVTRGTAATSAWRARGGARRGLAAALLVAAGLLPGTAEAYVRTRTTSKKASPAAWVGRCVYIQPDSAGSPDLPFTEVTATIKRSIDSWNQGVAPCGAMQLQYDEPTSRDAYFDGFNMIKFRTDRWCHPDDKQSKDVCYSPAAAAITSVFMVNDGGARDGLIVDADIEFNNLDFTFATVGNGLTPPRPSTMLADFENTLTHELGHLLGLSHTCRDAASFEGEVDETGQEPPACNQLASLPSDVRTRITDATMFNFASPGETKKRSLEADDLAGACAAYPASQGDRSCERTDLDALLGRGCAFTGHPAARSGPAPAVGLAALMTLLAAVRRRRRAVDFGPQPW